MTEHRWEPGGSGAGAAAFVTVVLIVATVLAFTLLLLGSAKAEKKLPPECGKLVALEREYRGKKLSLSERVIKSQMVAWYRINCRLKS